MLELNRLLLRAIFIIIILQVLKPNTSADPLFHYDIRSSNLGAATAFHMPGNYYIIAIDTGKVGINVLLPEESLDVFGRIKLDDGNKNVVIGSSSENPTSGASNTYLGTEAGQSAVGSNNTALGNGALKNSTVGQDHVAIGRGALQGNSGNYNVGLGFLSLYGTQGSHNFSSGYQSAMSTIGNHGIFLGYRSGRNSNSGYLIALGSQPGEGAIAATDGVYIGRRAGNLAGSVDNVGIGRFALSGGVSGFENVAIGSRAFANLTSGQRAVAIGAGAGAGTTTGEDNTFVGWRAGFQNNGDRNTMVGESANDQSWDGDENTYIGTRAAHDNGNGSYNTAIGYGALYFSQSLFATEMIAGQEYEIFIVGVPATDYTTLGAEDNVTGITFIYNGNPISGAGRVRSRSSSEAPDNNTALGYEAGKFVGIGSGNVFIGYKAGAGVYASGQSNKLWLDNSNTDTPLIYGDFDADLVQINSTLETTNLKINGLASGDLAVDANGNVIIGSTSNSALGPSATTSLSTSINDFNPVGWSDHIVHNLDVNSPINLTGFSALADGTIRHITNVGTSDLTITLNDSSSDETNQMGVTPGFQSFVFSSGKSVSIRYDASYLPTSGSNAGRWILID